MPVDVLGKGKCSLKTQQKTIAYISGYSVLEVGVTLRRRVGVYETLGKTFANNYLQTVAVVVIGRRYIAAKAVHMDNN